MPGKVLDIVIEQGATFELQIKCRFQDAPIDFTGYSARMQLRADYDSPVAIISLSTEPSEGIVIDPEEGKLQVVISAAETAQIKYLTGRYDLELESPDGKVMRLLEGKFTLSREVTR